MKKAWIENNKVRDIAQGNPAEIYHPDIAAHYDIDIPDDIEAGASLVNGVWVNMNFTPTAGVREWGIEEIRPYLTLSERVKWDNNSTDAIKTVKLELANGLNEAKTTEVLQLLVDAGDISQASMDKILA
jgi:hypothetical protein